MILASYTWEDAADALTALSDEAIIEQVGAFDTQVPVVELSPKSCPVVNTWVGEPSKGTPT